MCDPVTLTLAAVAVTSAGQMYSGIAASQQATYQAKIADRNAQFANQQAADSEANTRTEAMRRYRELSMLKGQQEAATAANGIDLGFGSSLNVQRDTAMIGAEDVGQIYKAGYERTRGFGISAANYRSEASAQRRAAKNALVQTAFGVASTALGGASQISQFNALSGISGASGFSGSRSGVGR